MANSSFDSSDSSNPRESQKAVWVEKIKRRLSVIGKIVLAVAAGLAVGMVLVAIAGENPGYVLKVLGKSAFGSAYDWGMTLFYATPLVFTGLAVAIPLRAGLFNIGAEGQLSMGALAMAVAGIGLSDSSMPKAVMAGLIIAAGMFAGGVWGAIPGWLKARRGSHEVINTIMLNFVAAAICSWVTLYLFKNPLSQAPETAEIATALRWGNFSAFDGAPVSMATFWAVVASIGSWFWLMRTSSGFEVRAVGENPIAAEVAGISVGSRRVLVMTIAGALAAWVGASEVLGSAGKFKLDFSPGYGFQGIAVALLARNHPIGILFSALLFGALHKGSLDLDLETEKVTRDLSMILQALVILSVSAEGLWSRRETNFASKWWMRRRVAPPSEKVKS